MQLLFYLSPSTWLDASSSKVEDLRLRVASDQAHNWSSNQVVTTLIFLVPDSNTLDFFAVTQNDNPSVEEIDRIHKELVDGLRTMYNQHRHLGPCPDRDLVIL